MMSHPDYRHMVLLGNALVYLAQDRIKQRVSEHEAALIYQQLQPLLQLAPPPVAEFMNFLGEALQAGPPYPNLNFAGEDSPAVDAFTHEALVWLHGERCKLGWNPDPNWILPGAHVLTASEPPDWQEGDPWLCDWSANLVFEHQVDPQSFSDTYDQLMPGLPPLELFLQVLHFSHSEWYRQYAVCAKAGVPMEGWSDISYA